MDKRRARTLLMASLTIMLCMAMIVGATYALFSSHVTVTNHLEAGTLNVSLHRESYTKTVLDQDGYLTEVTGGEADFSGENGENIFGLDASGEKIVPGSSYEAKIQLVNNDSSVAFDYSIVIVLDADKSDSDLAQQMIVYVNGEEAGKLSDYTADGERSTILSGVMTKTEATKDFTIKIVFDENGTKQDADVYFDLVVTAVQKTHA